MAKSLAQINRQIERLQRQAESLKQQEVNGVIGRIKTAIDHYGLTAGDLGLTAAKAGRAGVVGPGKAARKAPARKSLAVSKPVPVKYRDDTGNTWSGRGKRPNWFKAALEGGKSLEELSV